MDSEVAHDEKGCAAGPVNQVRVGLGGAGHLVASLALLGPLGDVPLFGLAEVVAGRVLTEIDLDTAAIRRDAGSLDLRVVLLMGLDRRIERINFRRVSLRRG